MESEELKTLLIEKIKLAFEDVEYPGDGALHRNDETEELIGRHWKDMPVEMLRVDSRILYLNPAALRFYLPAYLIAIIAYPDEMDVLVSDIVHFLSPSPKLSWKTETIPYLPNFEPKEKAAIRAFIEAYKDLFPEYDWSYSPRSNEALERAIAYWQYYGG
jgi:hypothetical protein